MQSEAAVRAATDGGARSLPAPAKINLSLHVTGRGDDGYHRIDGLVAFAAHGDLLTIADAPRDRLTLGGPFAAGVPAGADNLLFKALRLLREVAARDGETIPPVALHLDKRLPVASGIGGGSADAAALLNALLADRPRLRAGVAREAARLGADVPMCLSGCPARVRGIGEIVEPLAAFPRTPTVLVNPGVPVETRAVFAALAERDNAPPPDLPAGGLRDIDALVAYLLRCRNDLAAPALGIAPAIGEAEHALVACGARLARMSGSGASVFALFSAPEAARAAAETIAKARPRWWVVATKCEPAGEDPR